MNIDGFIEVIKNGEFWATMIATFTPLLPSLLAMLGTISKFKNSTVGIVKELKSEVITLKSKLADVEKEFSAVRQELNANKNLQKQQLAILSIMITNSNLSSGTKTEIMKILNGSGVEDVGSTVENANKKIEKADAEKVEQSSTLEEIARENEDEIIMG